MFTPIRWEDGALLLLDQRELPRREVWLRLTDWRSVAEAIAGMAVRGAPAIGIAAAYALVLAVRNRPEGRSPREAFREAAQGLAGTRPTAVNLAWAIDRMAAALEGAGECPVGRLEEEARRIHEEDIAANLRMGDLGARLLPEGARVLTICNTGALATGGYGTALGVVRRAWEEGRLKLVYVCETRPLLQGMRLTAWELRREGIPFELIVDSAAGWLMAKRGVDAVLVGADRVAANGDTANKIGTYTLAVLAARHGVPFYVIAPTSTVDPRLPDGGQIPIEERGEGEVLRPFGVSAAPAGSRAWNPAFDVTPAELITAIVTEKGVLRPPYHEAIPRLFA